MTMAHSSCSVVLLSSALYTYKTPFLPLFISPHLIPSPMEFRTRTAFNLDDDTSSKRKNGSSSGATKRGPPGSGGVAPPSCQADACPAVLTDAKRYHRRHKVCEFHSKSPVVIVSGLRQRFCQQCSRFHELSEFDDAKRSCRRRLAGHNERRRKSTSAEPGEGKIGSSSSSSSSQIQCRIISSDENSNRVQAIRVRDRPRIFKLDEDLN